MALVMLPCELPWWPSLQRYLKHILLTSSTQKIIDGMIKIHHMCYISLDPDEESQDDDCMDGFAEFLEQDLSVAERTHFIDYTLPNIVKRALFLKQWKPPGGLIFSLQQQSDYVELSYDFISSLIAHAFFSTFPRRTIKTHPTLQDFNFINFFKYLRSPFQKAKLKSILHYFDWVESNNNDGTVKISRQVMDSKQWLTIEDWLECNIALCKMQFKHSGKIEDCNIQGVETCFCNSRLGGEVLKDGSSQESLLMCTIPETLVIMLFIESLEDNEAIRIEEARRFSKIVDQNSKFSIEMLSEPLKVSLCYMDPENYFLFPKHQYEEDNILRELNKCLLSFQQKKIKLPDLHKNCTAKRLSPIGESFSHTPPEEEEITTLDYRQGGELKIPCTKNFSNQNEKLSNKKENIRGRFIVLGSSGECLPIKRQTTESCDSLYSSCNSSFDEFHSASASFDAGDADDIHYARKYSLELNTSEGRENFARQLKDVLRNKSNNLSDSLSTDSSYAVGISISGSDLQDIDIKFTRGGSCGFVLQEDLFEQTSRNLLEIKKDEKKQHRDNSSKFSFSSEYSSEFEEITENFNDWSEDILCQNNRELNERDIEVVKFASSLLKRTLSESFVGVCLNNNGLDLNERFVNKKKIMAKFRSLSLELAKQKHKLAAQMLSQLVDKSVNGSIMKPIVTGNWGCGKNKCGDPQLKLIIQWLAASISGTPLLIYYTHKNSNLYKLDTLFRILIDRKWTVSQLISATLKYAEQILHEPHVIHENNSLFDELIGIERFSDE